MRYLRVSGIRRPMARAVLGTEDYYLADYDARAGILDAYLAGGGNVLDTARTYGIGKPVGPHGAAGASNWSIDRLAAANAYAKANGLQGFSLLSNQFGLATPCRPRWPGTQHLAPEERARLTALGVANQAWSAQCSGFFAIAEGAPEHPDPDFRRAFHTPENFARRERARSLAGELGLAPTQVALAYTLNQEFSSLGVFWPADLNELGQCLAAADLVLTPGQVRYLETGQR